MIFIRKNFQRAIILKKNVGGVSVLVLCASSDGLMVVYICTKFNENILNGIRIMERTRKVNRWTDWTEGTTSYDPSSTDV